MKVAVVTIMIMAGSIISLLLYRSEQMNPKFKKGDIVYLQPDSTKVIVARVYCNLLNNVISYHVLSNGKIFDNTIDEQLIYDPKK